MASNASSTHIMSSPKSTRRPLPHLMSSSHNGILSRMTTENGQQMDIYENPSEHYGIMGSSFSSPFQASPFLGAYRKSGSYFKSNLGTKSWLNLPFLMKLLCFSGFTNGEGIYNERLGEVIETDDNVTDEDDLNDSSQKPIMPNTASNLQKPTDPWRMTNYSGSSSLSSFSYSPRSNNSSVSSQGKKLAQKKSDGSLRSTTSSQADKISMEWWSLIKNPNIWSISTRHISVLF